MKDDEITFDDTGEELEELPSDVWSVDVRPPEGDLSTSPSAKHEWVFIAKVATPGSDIENHSTYECRRCGLRIAINVWEDPNKYNPNEDPVGSCTEHMLRGTQES